MLAIEPKIILINKNLKKAHGAVPIPDARKNP
jgi:hypothetical protein